MNLPSTFKPLLFCLACLFCHAGGTFAQTAGRTTYYKDADGDGFGDLTKPKTSKSPVRGYVLNALDCNDRDQAINPGAAEGMDGKDNDCDGMTDEVSFYQDNDGDGFGSAVSKEAVSRPAGYAASAGDCDDAYDKTYPGAPETCDGKDNDCDGGVDEGVKTTFYADADGDGFGNPNASVEACSVPDGYLTNNTDADDTDNTIYPGAAETCDGKDNDQDGQTDEGVKTVFYADADKDSFGDPNASVEACSVPAGYVVNQADADDTDNTIYPNAPELCDGKDNDQDGDVDEGVKTTFYADKDGDGFGTPADTRLACTKPDGYAASNTDADDTDNTIYPGAPEICDNKDNDQNGQTDERLATSTFYQDADGDGFGNPDARQPACSMAVLPVLPNGVQWVMNGADQNDGDATVYPGAPELCDGKDNDQDGQTDEGVKTVFYADADGDGYGNPNATVEACSVPAGYAANNTDANDADGTTYPGATEICDNKDNDQDGQTDEGLVLNTYYRDADGDYRGNPDVTVLACSRPAGYSAEAGDCNDSDASIYRGAFERCGDGKDNDCNGTVDDTRTYYRDADGDGYGSTSGSILACSQPTGFVWRGGDCNDRDAGINPNARERCDGKDNDCNGLVDDNVNIGIWIRDADGDGWGAGSTVIYACTRPDGYVYYTQSGDCNDRDRTTYPGAPELCDGRDNDCDRYTDEGCPRAARVAASGATERTLRPASNLYPNPATRELTIDLSRPAADLKSIAFATVVDQPVAANPHVVIGESKIRIRVDQLKPGLYVIRLDFGDGYEVLKFLKH